MESVPPINRFPKWPLTKWQKNIIKLPGSAHESRITCDSHSQRRSVNAGDATTRDRFKKAPGWVVRTCLKYGGFLLWMGQRNPAPPILDV